MQWILQDFEDTKLLASALERRDVGFSLHKVVPFIGDLVPPPSIPDRHNVVLFGSYSLWRYAEREGLRPGVFKLRPFVFETAWRPHLLNGPDALMLTLRATLTDLPDTDTAWFMRPVADSKEAAGRVWQREDIIALAERVCALNPDEIPLGSMRPDTRLMLSRPARILKEWRIWVVAGQVVTWSLYKEGRRVVYRPEIDDDARAFAQQMADLNPGYSPAFVMDICRTDSGLHLLETNCINAAGFYAADLGHLIEALERLQGSG